MASLAILLSVLWLPFESSVDQASGKTAYSVQDLVRGLKAREAAIRNFQVKAELKVKSKSRYTGEYLQSANVQTTCRDNRTQRFWYRKIGQVYNSPGHPAHGGKEFFFDIEEFMAFDGERTRKLTWPRGTNAKPDEMLRSGTIYPGRKEWIVVDPGAFTTMLNNENISGYIDEVPLQHVLLTDSDRLVLAEIRRPRSPNDPPDQVETRQRLWIDVEHGMVVTRRESSLLRKGEREWIPVHASRLEDLFEAEKGIWLPREYSEESYQVLPGKEPYLVSAITRFSRTGRSIGSFETRNSR